MRTVPSQVNAVDAMLAATVNPADPSTVTVSQPTAILQAEALAQGAYNGLFLALGAVALLVGGVGIANVMFISVLERRSVIGLRQALGATRRHVTEQFLAEAVLLSVLGGLASTVIGAVATAIYALSQHWSVQIPPEASPAEPAPPRPSARSPACTQRCEPPASRQPRHYAPHDRPAGRSPRPGGLPAHHQDPVPL